MNTIEYRTVDKSMWGDGPWQGEPDKRQWRDDATGLPCLIVRNHHGSLCGYVGIGSDHPFFGRDTDTLDGLDVHGGVTFARECQEGKQSESICHIPDAGEPDHMFWIGFDCSHAGDTCPATEDGLIFDREEYRDIDYVAGECRSLALQLEAVRA